MSDSYFNYKQNILYMLADQLHEIIKTNNVPDETGYVRDLDEHTINVVGITMFYIDVTFTLINNLDKFLVGETTKEQMLAENISFFNKFYKENKDWVISQVGEDIYNNVTEKLNKENL